MFYCRFFRAEKVSEEGDLSALLAWTESIAGRSVRLTPSSIALFFTVAAFVPGVAEAAAGNCNSSTVGNCTKLQGPWGIHVSSSDGTLYIAEWDAVRFQAFAPSSFTGRVILSSGLNTPSDVFVDSSNTIYMVDHYLNGGTVFVQRAGVIQWRFPAAGRSTSSCLLDGIFDAYSIAVDRSGNVYIGLFKCYAVVKWAPNAIAGVAVAGQPGTQGSTNRLLGQVRFIYLDEDRSYLYVSDSSNHRIQRFIIGGNGTAVTVAGTGNAGTALNRLNSPSGICVTADGQTLYVADYENNRVMKWQIGGSQGSVIAGSASGVSGRTALLLDHPADVALDPTETYLYVSDYNNNRIQRFRLR